MRWCEGFFAEVHARWPSDRGLLSQGTLLGGRHADSGLGEPEELRAQGRQRRQPPGGGAERNAASRLERPTAHQRHPREHAPTPTRELIARAITRRRSSVTKGHVLMENRNGLVVSAVADPCRRLSAERRAALAMLDAVPDTGAAASAPTKPTTRADFVAGCRERKVTPHVASNTPAVAAAPSTGAPRGIPVTRSAR